MVGYGARALLLSTVGNRSPADLWKGAGVAAHQEICPVVIDPVGVREVSIVVVSVAVNTLRTREEEEPLPPVPSKNVAEVCRDSKVKRTSVIEDLYMESRLTSLGVLEREIPPHVLFSFGVNAVLEAKVTNLALRELETSPGHQDRGQNDNCREGDCEDLIAGKGETGNGQGEECI